MSMAASKPTRFDVGASVRARAAVPAVGSDPARAGTVASTSIMRCVLIWHLRYRPRAQALQKATNFHRVVFGVGGKHDQEKSVLSGKSKARHIKDRMVG